ncbi:glycerophosphodiester phosphodiesterase [Streptomyces nogalater]
MAALPRTKTHYEDYGTPPAGASGVEFDVWWTQDGIPVLSHDPTVDRTTTGHGPIAAMTASQVRALRTKRASRCRP